ncbi:Cbb3-type cytochrome c oxidase subunit [Gammaproteobacteria bacterium]
MSEFWSVWIVVLTLGSIFACSGLIGWTIKHTPEDLLGDGKNKMHHSCQSWADIHAYNNQVPRWWLSLFYVLVFFALIYFSLYPSLGRLPGTLKWISQEQYTQESRKYNIQYAARFNRYLSRPIVEIAQDPEARQIGQRLFLTYCTNCHQLTGQDTPHYPNLADKDWLWGGEPEKIEETITKGRSGIMPGWGTVLSEQGVGEIASYVMALSGHQSIDASKVTAGREGFALYCAFCHNPDGTGNLRLGAPNLTDNIWLHIGSREAATDAGLEAGIKQAINNGFTNSMPAHWKMLDQAKIHLLAGYIYGLSNAK